MLAMKRNIKTHSQCITGRKEKMKTSEQFLKAKKDKSLRALLVIQREGKTNIRLCIDGKIPYTDKVEQVFVETETEISIENYSSYENEERRKRAVNSICFHESFYSGFNHIGTFLDAIKKDSDVRFKAVVFNGSNDIREVGFVRHSLYGIIDNNKSFLLSSYCGKDNSASPIQ